VNKKPPVKQTIFSSTWLTGRKVAHTQKGSIRFCFPPQLPGGILQKSNSKAQKTSASIRRDKHQK